MLNITTFKKPSEFKRIQNHGEKWVTKAFVILADDPPPLLVNSIYYGIIASGKLGTAVVRNRVRRRLREVIRALLPEFGQEGYRYVFIARSEALNYPFDMLKKDLKWALEKIHQKLKERNDGSTQ